MDKTITVFASFEQMKEAELREWQLLPDYERLRMVSDLTAALYHVKEPNRDVRRIQRTLVQLQREKR